jgi:transcriptional regulator with XRE-family HTH domain
MGGTPRKRRTGSLHDDAYVAFVNDVAQLRKGSKLSQRRVADALGWNQSQISKIETKQRRLDVVELIRIAEVVGFDATTLVREMRKRLRTSEFD